MANHRAYIRFHGPLQAAFCTWTIPVLSPNICSMIVIVKGDEIAGVRPFVVHAVREERLDALYSRQH